MKGEPRKLKVEKKLKFFFCLFDPETPLDFHIMFWDLKFE